MIVGGGIGGLTLAAVLHARGIDASNARTSGRLWRRTLRRLRVVAEYGLDRPVVAGGMTVERWVFANQAGGTLCEIDLDEVWGDVGPFVGTARARYLGALDDDAQIHCSTNGSKPKGGTTGGSSSSATPRMPARR